MATEIHRNIHIEAGAGTWSALFPGGRRLRRARGLKADPDVAGLLIDAERAIDDILDGLANEPPNTEWVP